MTRLYYEGEGKWAIDNGPGTLIHLTTGPVEIVTHGKVVAQTEMNPDADNTTEPCAWLQIEDQVVDIALRYTLEDWRTR